MTNHRNDDQTNTQNKDKVSQGQTKSNPNDKDQHNRDDQRTDNKTNQNR